MDEKWTRRARDIEISIYGSRYEIINNGCAAVMAGDASIHFRHPSFSSPLPLHRGKVHVSGY